MWAVLHLLFALVVDCFKSRRRLEIENLYLRHQLNIAMRKQQRLRLRGADRAFMVWMIRLRPGLLSLSRVVRPDTILRWHRAGFRAYWRWKSRRQPGRPKISSELRELIRRMSRENRLWGAPRIHGELLKLGFEVAESTVSKYMIPPPRATVANLANVSAQSCGWDRSDRSVRGAHGDIPAPVCTHYHRSWAPPAALVRRNPASDGRMVGAADRRGVPVGHRTSLLGPRQ